MSRDAADAAAAPEVLASQLLGALARRRASRREVLAELRGALTALGAAVEQHALRVEEVERLIAARAAGADRGPPS